MAGTADSKRGQSKRPVPNTPRRGDRANERSTVSKSVRLSWIPLLLIIAGSLIFRIVYLVQVSSIPTFDSPTMDEGYHMELATQINSPTGYPPDPYFRAPLYPYFLALLLKLTSFSHFGVRLIQLLLGTTVPIVTYLLGRKLFDSRIALLSAGIAAFYPTLIYYDASLLITVLEVLLTLLLTFVLYRYDGTTAWPPVVAGVLLGLAGLARPNLLVIGPPLIIWTWLILKPKIGLRRSIAAYVTVGICAAATILPVTIRNYTVGNDFVSIAWQGGYNFYVGNNRTADGWSARADGIDPSWKGGYYQSIAIAEEDAGRPLKMSEVSDYWTGRAFREMAADPGHFVSLLVTKARLLINGYEIPNNQDEYMSKSFSSIMDSLLWRGPLYFPYGVLAPLGIVGLILSLKEWRRFLITYIVMGSFAVSLLMFFVCARYRQPLIPFLILFAVYGVFRLIDLFKQVRYRVAWLYLLLLAILAIESNHDILNLNRATVQAENSDLIGNAYLRKGQLDRALAEYKKGVEADPAYGRGYNNVGTVLVRQRHYGQATGYLKRAMQLDSRLAEPYINLSICYSETRDTANAVRILEEARGKFPTNSYVHYYLGMAYFDEGRRSDAVTSTARAVTLDPTNTGAQQFLRELQNMKPRM